MRRALAALLLASGATACGGDGDGERERTLTVLAAASLTETFSELAEAFEAQHAGVDVQLVPGSSTTLAEQVADGAPGDVLATADEASMDIADGATVGSSQAFATNRLTLVTPPDNPAGIASVDDLGSPGVDLVACAVTAPCGAIAAELLDSAGIEATPVSEEVDVKAVLGRVTDGEADAGLVYRTDAVAAGDAVTEVAVPEAADLSTTYLIAALASARGEQADLAAAFVELVRSAEGQQVLADAGFGTVVVE